MDPELTVDDSQAVPEEQEALEERLQSFGDTLAKTRDKWIQARAASGWDRRVAKDLDAYHMRDAATKAASSMMESVASGGPVMNRKTATTRSTIYVGITRQKTNAAEARLSDILLPTDDRNWGIRPTPDPEGALAKEEGGQLVDPMTGQPVLIDPETGAVTNDPAVGKPLTKTEVAMAAERAAVLAAKSMTQVIEDQLVESDYNSEQRKMIHDAAVMGTGVIKGPIVTKRVRKAWRERSETDPETGVVRKIQAMEMVEELKPASYRVDPTLVWEDPDCGDDVQNGQGIFELEKLTPKRVRELAKQPGYMKPQILKVLKEGAKRSTALIDQTRLGDDNDRTTGENGLFCHWIYTGELLRDDLEAAGVEVSEDELDVVSGVVEMINDTVVRAYLNPLESGELPYDFYPWEKIQGSPRGYGLPYLMAAEQSATNAAWRQMMDNSGITAGPQIVINRKLVQPMGGGYELRPFKFWEATDDTVDVNKAFQAVEFNSHQSELAGIIDLAAKLGDQSSGVPMIVTGEKGSAPDTVGGMQLLMNSANVVLRRLVKQYDDFVTKRHIRRYYDYNMAYNPDDKVKGDFQVDARGSSALLVRDIQNQAYTNLLAAGSNPMYSPYVDPRKLFEKALQGQHIDPRDIFFPDEKIKQNLEAQANAKDPRIQTAEINAQARMMQAEAVAQGRATETEVLREAEVESRRLRYLQMEREYELEILKLANSKDLTIEQIKAQLAQTTLQERTRKELAASKLMYDDKAADRIGPKPGDLAT